MAWVGGLAEWQDGDVTYLSVAFTWKLAEARSRAIAARAMGRRVRADRMKIFGQIVRTVVRRGERMKTCIAPLLSAGHSPDCAFRIAETCAIPVECEHGYDCCPTCDPCTCARRSPEPK